VEFVPLPAIVFYLRALRIGAGKFWGWKAMALSFSLLLFLSLGTRKKGLHFCILMLKAAVPFFLSRKCCLNLLVFFWL